MTTETAQGALTALGQATSGGLLVAALAFVACRVVKKLTAPIRFWLWWLVGAKFLLGLLLALIGVSAFRIPVIKAEHYYHLQGLARKTVAERVLPAPIAPAKNVTPANIAATTYSGSVAGKPLRAPERRYSRWYQMQRVVRQGWGVAIPWILVLYSLGLVIAIARLLRGKSLVNRLLATTTPGDNEVITEAQDIAGRLRLSRCPTIRFSPDAVPCVLGVFRATVVLPQSFRTETAAARRMALAHEMAHLRRHDLILDIVPVLLRTVFWFLPVAHYAAQEISAAREEACDLIAVRVCETTPAVYASLLVSVAGRSKRPIPALAMAAPTSRGFRAVRRRVQTLAREGTGRPVPVFWRGVAIVLLLTQGAATLLPLRPALARAAEVARAVLPAVPDAPRYVLTDLGTLGGKQSGAFAINDAGQVAGGANIYPLGSMGHAFVWDGDTMRDVNVGAVYRHSQAIALSDNGQVAGFAYRSSYRSTQQLAFVFDGKRRMFLNPAPGYHFARATGVSENGTVVGASLGGGSDKNGASITQATLWQNGAAHNLGTLGGAHSIALGVNDDGVVVGKADVASEAEARSTHAFVYDPTNRQMHDLQTLGGNNSVAYAINKTGLVVGYSETDTADRVVQGTVWNIASPDAKAQPLGSLATGDSRAFAVSDRGDIVGQSMDGQGNQCAVVWKASHNTMPVNLNDCLPAEVQEVWHLETARGVNSHGQIVGQGIVNGVRHAFLLTPISE